MDEEEQYEDYYDREDEDIEFEEWYDEEYPPFYGPFYSENDW